MPTLTKFFIPLFFLLTALKTIASDQQTLSSDIIKLTNSLQRPAHFPFFTIAPLLVTILSPHSILNTCLHAGGIFSSLKNIYDDEIKKSQVSEAVNKILAEQLNHTNNLAMPQLHEKVMTEMRKIYAPRPLKRLLFDNLYLMTSSVSFIRSYMTLPTDDHASVDAQYFTDFAYSCVGICIGSIDIVKDILYEIRKPSQLRIFNEELENYLLKKQHT